jgi:hypothetical protein
LVACSQSATQAPVDAVKILVEEGGVYRIAIKDLEENGLALDGASPATLQLTDQGRNVPFYLSDDALIFYGQASTDRYSTYRPYILRQGAAGRAISSKDATPVGPAYEHITRTLRLEQNYEYVSDAAVGEGETPWFWQTISLQGQAEIPFSVTAPASGAGTLSVRLYGATQNREVDPDHTLEALVNGTQVGTITWDGQVSHSARLTLPDGTLQEGTNTLLLNNLPEDYLDIMRLDSLMVTYDARPKAVNEALAFTAADGQVTLTGFKSRPLLLDVTDPANPMLLTGTSFAGDSVILSGKVGEQIVAVGSSGYLTPSSVSALNEADWREVTHQADLIIITTEELAPALDPLVAQREAQGLTVAVVPAIEIYDAFGEGAATPDSINRFLTYAYETWQKPAPRYVLLVGEATTDYRGYLAGRPESPVAPPRNIIPPYLVPVDFSGETVSDARLADVDGDEKPEMAVGRWPVDSVREATALVERTLAYEQGASGGHALFASDGSSNEFAIISERIAAESGFQGDQATFLAGPSAAELTQRWNDGAWLVTYTGHGSLELWGKDGVFTAQAASDLTDGNGVPIVLQLTCLTGFFAHPETQSLSEALLLDDDGPVLIVGATSLTLSAFQEPFAIAFLDALRDDETLRVGDALEAAKEALPVERPGLREISDTFGLLGDPSALIVRP